MLDLLTDTPTGVSENTNMDPPDRDTILHVLSRCEACQAGQVGSVQPRGSDIIHLPLHAFFSHVFFVLLDPNSGSTITCEALGEPPLPRVMAKSQESGLDDSIEGVIRRRFSALRCCKTSYTF